ncbi:MAG: DUF2079 domain-containing protein [Acidimicrobiia bacterium]|nr:DUF2079 domain-containing protein [Actinomycetota bacterium]MBL6923782.1 DUF2079 domain-containing protein [Acidimicrobiia bacterium]MBL6927474.1 DUF2079 domain-containing protein [Acidimicrobiia bacterium]
MKATLGLERTGEQMVTTVHSLRRRLDIQMLRWQARLDAPGVDRYLPWGLAIVFWVILALLAIARSRDLGLSPQVGHYLQAVHLMGEGLSPVVSEWGFNVFANQAAFLFWPVARLAVLLPSVETLLVLQALALAVTVVPLWRVARGPANLRVSGAATLAVAFALHPSVHNLNLAGFHPEVFALPALLAAYLATHRQNWWALGVLVAIVVTARADLGLAVTALGLLFVTEDRRRVGWSLAAFGMSWFLVMAFVVQPMFGDGVYPHITAFAHYGDSSFGVLLGMLADPVGLLGDLMDRASFEKMLLLVAPVLFLPLVRPRYIVTLLPLTALYLVADVPEDVMGNPQQDVPALVFVFIATAFALMRIGTRGISRVLVDRRVLTVMVLTASVFFVRDAAASPYEKPWDWGSRDHVDSARVSATTWVGDEASVLASPVVFPLLADRESVYVLDGATLQRVDPEIPDTIDVVVFDRETSGLSTSGNRAFEHKLVLLDFRSRFEAEGVSVWVRRPGSS